MIFTLSRPYKADSGIIMHPAFPSRNDLFQWEKILQETFPSSEISVCNANGFENALFFPSTSSIEVWKNYCAQNGA